MSDMCMLTLLRVSTVSPAHLTSDYLSRQVLRLHVGFVCVCVCARVRARVSVSCLESPLVCVNCVLPGLARAPLQSGVRVSVTVSCDRH